MHSGYCFLLMAALTISIAGELAAEDGVLRLRFLGERPENPGKLERLDRDETLRYEEAAVIVCDVWDYHHCLNAVRRLEEFAPRLNEVLTAARKRGATIIHSPRDCMAAYAEHPARLRAKGTPVAAKMPKDIQHWCSRNAAEEKAVYPIDQSDGGEDDDPQEHAEWAARLKGLGRNPNMPWKMQSPLITIDAERDYVSDRGDEVWSILEARKIKQVILTGVHTNMCVLGRPFGLRQMVKNGKQVALMRDMTDCMYNPRAWPYVDHFTGNDLIIAHVERYICPTITSDQLLGGEPFRSKTDVRKKYAEVELYVNIVARAKLQRDNWALVDMADDPNKVFVPGWQRCAVRLPKEWIASEGLSLTLPKSALNASVWWNGKALHTTRDESGVLHIAADWVVPDEANLLVMHIEKARAEGEPGEAPELISGKNRLALFGRWQIRVVGNDPSWSNIPLPAKFGASPDILFEPRN